MRFEAGERFRERNYRDCPPQTEALRPKLSRRFVERIQDALLWLLGFSGSVVFIEPSPYEATFLVAVAGFLLTGGLAFHRSIVVLLLTVVTFNLGGLFSLMPFLDDTTAVTFVAVSAYLGVTSLFFSSLMTQRPVERLKALKSGLIWAAVLASTAGILGYFNVGGLGEHLTRYGRASGTFKDPNVLGTFVILPLVFLGQDLLLRRGSLLKNAALLILILFGGVFLSFSRGAWAHAVLSLVLLLALTFIFTPSRRLRARIVLIAVAGTVALALAFITALSIDSVRELYEARAGLSQDYDLGETGRFGNQLRSINELVELPNGFGPLRFRLHFPEDPHNVYVNAFASYGWLGGFSYLLLILATVFVGWKTVVARLSVQPYAVVIWSTLFVEILQGFQIDTDHWRHFWLMLGLIWGLFGLAQAHRRVGMTHP
jgi:hypothetical protein